jgi:AraC-like DNA-binding protein
VAGAARRLGGRDEASHDLALRRRAAVVGGRQRGYRDAVLLGVVPGIPVLAWPAAVAVWGPGGRAELHAHHAMHLVVAVRGGLRVRTSARGSWREGGAAVVTADAPHAIDAEGAEVVIVFVDPDSSLGLGLRGAMTEPVRIVGADEVATWRAALPAPAAMTAAAVDGWLRAAVPGSGPPPAVHPRVRRVLRHLRAGPLEKAEVTIDALAAVAGLSATRLLHVFTASVGVPIRPYVRWLRVQRAAAAMGAGVSITDAAHGAGFADAAHLTRTFRRVFGTTPSELLRRSQFVQARAVADP